MSVNGDQVEAGSGRESSLDFEGLEALLGPRGAAPAAAAPESLAATGRLLEQERGFAATLRALPTSQRLGIALLFAGLWPVVVLVVTPRADLGVFPLGRMALDLALLGAAAVLLIAITHRPLHRPNLPRPAVVAGVVAALAAVAAIATLPVAHSLHPASLAGVAHGEVGPRALACFLFGAVFALISLLGLALLWRGPQRVPGMAAAGAATAVGSLAVYLHCPITQPLHLWLGHVTAFVPVFVFALVMRR